MKHQWILTEDGSIDAWQLDYEFHSGPRCALCDYSECETCHKVYEDESCDGGIAKRKKIALHNAEIDEKISAICWALLAPEQWDQYKVDLAQRHREVLENIRLELISRKMTMTGE